MLHQKGQVSNAHDSDDEEGIIELSGIVPDPLIGRIRLLQHLLNLSNIIAYDEYFSEPAEFLQLLSSLLNGGDDSLEVNGRKNHIEDADNGERFDLGVHRLLEGLKEPF